MIATVMEREEAPAGAFCISGPYSEISRRGGITIVGAKGGKGGGSDVRAPIEAPDSLHSTSYAKVLDLVSEGPVVGPVHGIGGLLRDIYLDGTPIQNDDGTLNFEGVRADFRAGTQDQDYIAGFPAAESAIGIGIELRSDQSFLRQFTNPNLSAVRVTLEVRGLSQTNTTNADINGYRVEYIIEVQTGGGAWQDVLRSAFDGKTTQTYARSHRIDLPPSTSGWNVRVTRLTANANSSTIADRTFIQAVSEIIDAKLRMPMSALVGVQIDAKQFQSVPQRAFHFRGRIISVPSNYDPATRVYTGTWDGTFKQAWSNCPPWIFYDLVSNDRYGLGAFVPASKLSMLKWALYPVAQYCDELVPDGFGGQEPRFTCNVYIQERADAYRVLADLASVFRGMVYEQGGVVMAAADIPGDPAYTYSAANVIDGRFNYTGSPRRTRYTVSQVSWNDMEDMGRAKMEAVESDRDTQVRYGLNVTQTTAFACSSRGQAVRAAKWALLTSQRETQAVTFSVGLDHAVVAPGRVIRVVDPRRAGRRIGGRIRSATRTVITTDLDVIVRPGDRLVVNLPSGVSESRIVSDLVGEGVSADGTTWRADSTEITADMVGLPGSTLTITVTQPFSELPEPESIWTVESEALTSQLFRVLSISRRTPLEAEIMAVQHEPGKYSGVDYGTKIDTRPITVVPPGVQAPPAQVTLSSYSVVVQGIAQHNGVIEWPAAKGAVAYQVQWRRDSSDWIEGGRTGSARLELDNIRTGAYVARARAINAANVPSVWTVSAETRLEGTIAPPTALAFLSTTSLIFGIQLAWGFPAGPSIIERAQIWYSQTNDRADATLLGEFPYPQSTHALMGLAAGARLYFWGRLIDKQGEIGPWYPSGVGVAGTASSDANPILDFLQGKITESQLGQALLEKIDGGGEAMVAVQQVVTALAALYTIKTQLTVDGVPYMAGIGVGVENDAGIITSQILLAAGRVAVLDETSGLLTAPFVIQGGQTFINQALIGTGWITNAMIGNFIQSNDFVPDQSGWQINKNGAIQINGTGGGGRMRLSNAGVRLYDPSGTLRIRMEL
ncbi:host specificity protein J [Bordetella genomosp. 13]|uniref:host specificity protein J n=1 Tax=Bordetella genomosp. 13 TaxID=463040 RepID=UPI0021B656A2|nr:phage tail protein [Bordetella genomosp. 13]